MNVVGAVFAVVAILILLYFGLGTTQIMMDDATENVGNNTELGDSLNTSKELTAPAFNIMSMLVYIVLLAAIIAGLYMLVKVL